MENVGFQTFCIKGKPVKRRDVIKYIQDNGPIFTSAAHEPDKVSKQIVTDGTNIWTE